MSNVVTPPKIDVYSASARHGWSFHYHVCLSALSLAVSYKTSHEFTTRETTLLLAKDSEKEKK